MNRNLLQTLLLLLPSYFMIGQGNYITEKGETHLLNKVTIDELIAYEPEIWKPRIEKTLEADIVPLLKDVKVQIFIGTWCGDSEKWVPEFLGMWDQAGLPNSDIEIIALHNEGDQYKRSPEEYEKGLNIHKVPTFIFYKDDAELGRIVERPINSLKTDISQIALGYPSKSRYRAVEMLDAAMSSQPLDSLYERNNYSKFLRKINREVTTASELNVYGHILKNKGEIPQAEFVFYVNRNLFRHNPNTWDSLGEIYLEQAKYEDALFNYERVLELNPKDENAQAQIDVIKEKLIENRKN